jgi:hypothetical protein
MEIQDGTRQHQHHSTGRGRRPIDVALCEPRTHHAGQRGRNEDQEFRRLLTHKSDLGLIYDPKGEINHVQDLKGKTLLCFSGSTWTPFHRTVPQVCRPSIRKR